MTLLMRRALTEKQLQRILYPNGRQKDIYRQLSYPVIKAILPLNIHPDFIHLCRLVFLIGGTVLFLQGTIVYAVIGALLFQLNILFDTFDGALARYRGIASVKGEYQDVFLDHLASSVLYFVSAAFFAYWFTNVLLYVWIGLVTVILAQFAAFQRALYLEYGVAAQERKQKNPLVAFAHQDNARLLAGILFLGALLQLPQGAVLFFLLVVLAKISICAVDIWLMTKKSPFNIRIAIRYFVVVLILVLMLIHTIIGINTSGMRRALARTKRPSVIEKQVLSRFT